MMHEDIKNFYRQFEYEPVVENGKLTKKFDSFVVAGMGGSNLAAGVLKAWHPDLQIVQHRNYGLPALPLKTLKKSLFIASSYSGNTEETISAFSEAVKKKLPVVAVAGGGRLLDLARKRKKPYIQIPNTGIQPRLATGFNLMALLKLMGNNNGLREARELQNLLKSNEYERTGKSLAKKFKGRVPVIYVSERNSAIGYNWKIKFNETGKIPAFTNVFPELNHNEMNGFDYQEGTKEISRKFSFLFLKDPSDNMRIIKRMNITERLYREREMPVEVLILNGRNPLHKIFSSILIADWASYYIAGEYGVNPEQVPMVEEFKKLIR